MDTRFFCRTSAEQANRFSNRQKKLLNQLKFAECLEKKVDMSKVNLEVIKPWITKRVTASDSGFEDDVVILNQREVKNPDSRKMQISLPGFLNGKNAGEFMGELWPLLLSAQQNIAGIPSAFLELKEEEIKQRQIEQEKLASMKKQDEDKDKRDKEEKNSRKKGSNPEAQEGIMNKYVCFRAFFPLKEIG
uniref:PWI domain-containing protein n=1 Tax=Monodelphis domestica TaxID=13616 RepID=A0A5F8GIA8_MONDO